MPAEDLAVPGAFPTSSLGPSPRSKWRSEKPLAKAAKVICGVFQQPWPGVSPTAILNDEKALVTRLGAFRVRQKEFSLNFNPTPAVLTQNVKSLT